MRSGAHVAAAVALMAALWATPGAGQLQRSGRGGVLRGSPAVGMRHEPIFGVGPHTTWRGGWGLEVEMEEENGETTLPIELLYGVTEELTVTMVLPFGSGPVGGGLDEVGLRAKWRFATSFSRGQMDALAMVGGITVPRTSVDGAPRGGPTAIIGMAAGRESRRWYYFAGLRGSVRLENDGWNPGDMLAANLAWGIRPRLSEYKAPDLVLLLEANGRFAGRTESNGAAIQNSGRKVVSIAPALLFSIRNIMFKGGIDLPVWSALNDPGATADPRVVAAVELHW